MACNWLLADISRVYNDTHTTLTELRAMAAMLTDLNALLTAWTGVHGDEIAETRARAAALTEGDWPAYTNAVFNQHVGGDSGLPTFGEIMGGINSYFGGRAIMELKRYMPIPHFIVQDQHLDAWIVNHSMADLFADYGVDVTDRHPDETEVDFLSRVTVHDDWETSYRGTCLAGRHHVLLEDAEGWDVWYAPLMGDDAGTAAALDAFMRYTPSSGLPMRFGFRDLQKLVALAPVVYETSGGP